MTQDDAERFGVMMYWGFLPIWAKRPLIRDQAEKLYTSNLSPYRVPALIPQTSIISC